MPDLFLTFGEDLKISPTGDLLTADGEIITEQRVLRRLMTNPGDYIWQLNYGAGLGRFVGQTGISNLVSGVIRAQLQLEPQVARVPTPTVRATISANGIVRATVNYLNSVSRETTLLSISI